MERKSFLQLGCRCGVGAVASMLLAPAVMAEGVPAVHGCLPQQDPELATQLHAWIVDLLAAMDADLDAPTRARILQACGRAEALRGAPVPPPPTVTLEQLATRLRVRLGEENVRLAGNRLEVAYPRCECPLVGPAPERLSDTWCECARGYMTAMMSGRLGRPVQVELLEAIKRGGQRCRWAFQV